MSAEQKDAISPFKLSKAELKGLLPQVCKCGQEDCLRAEGCTASPWLRSVGHQTIKWSLPLVTSNNRLRLSVLRDCT